MYGDDPAQVADEFEDDDRFTASEPNWALYGNIASASLIACLAGAFALFVWLPESKQEDLEFRNNAAIITASITWVLMYWGIPILLRWLRKS